MFRGERSRYPTTVQPSRTVQTEPALYNRDKSHGTRGIRSRARRNVPELTRRPQRSCGYFTERSGIVHLPMLCGKALILLETPVDNRKWDRLPSRAVGGSHATGTVALRRHVWERQVVLTRPRTAGIVPQSRPRAAVGRAKVLDIATCQARGIRPLPARTRSRHRGRVPCTDLVVRAEPCGSWRASHC